MKRIRLGIIGTGRIVKRFLSDAWQKTVLYPTAVFHPRPESAKAFLEEFYRGRPENPEMERMRKELFVTDRWEEFTAAIDAAYIASPHGSHEAYGKELLRAGKHVLCEKPMAFSKKTAEGLFSLAKEKKLVLMEAVKTAYCPGFQALLQTAGSGVIGEICDVEACFTKLVATNQREYTDGAYAGSMLELGAYGVLPILKIFGTEYEELRFASIKTHSGVDRFSKAMFTYPEGMGLAKMGIGVKAEGELIIAGTRGYLYVPAPWWLTRRFEVRYENPDKKEVYEYPYEGTGLCYETQAFERRILQGNGEYEQHEELSIALAKVMEAFLEQRRTASACQGTRKAEPLERTAWEGGKIGPEGGVKIWAHRGCSMEFPENTLPAFEAAAKLPGLTGIELDIQLSRDGEVVVFHDENLKRLTGKDQPLRELSLRELKHLRVCSAWEERAEIPTLEEVLTLLFPYCKEKGLLINIELKTSKVRYEGIEERAYESVKKQGLRDFVLYSSFLPESVKRIKTIDPAAKTGMLAGSLWDCIKGARWAGTDALHPWAGGFDCGLPEDMKGHPIRVYNGEEPFFRDGRILKERNLTKYAAFGATDIFTNVPELYLGRRMFTGEKENDKIKSEGKHGE